VTQPTPRTLERLYAVPPSAFVRERDATVAELKKAGHSAEARAVTQLRRPSATLWATNQLARIEADRLAAFLESVDRLRKAQLSDPRTAGTALRQQRAELEGLVQRASELLEAQRHRPTPEARERMSNTLLGAAVDRQLVEDLRHGRLTAELPAPGFEVLTGAPRGRHLHAVRMPQAPSAPKVAKRDEDRRAKAAAREQRQREAHELARAAAERQEAAEKHAREVAELAKNLEAARDRLSAARRAAKLAAAAARKARRFQP
jgi:hypothetical protein